jgi:hypothetical protein
VIAVFVIAVREPIALLIVCGMTIAIGISALYAAFRQRHKLTADTPVPASQNPAQPLSVEPVSLPKEIIRLPSQPAPSQSAHMSQQEKIAAALEKAGMSHPRGWPATEPASGSDPSPKNS